MRIFVYALFVWFLSGCAATPLPVATTGPSTQVIRDSSGQTQARIRDGSVYAPNGIRTHRIDSSGNIYSVQGANAGQRVGRITK